MSRHFAPAAVLFLALLLPPVLATRRSPRLQLSSVSDLHLEHPPPISRQETELFCPLQNLSCEQLCCPGRCCPSSLPFCISSSDNPSNTECVDSEGKKRCEKSGLLGTPCLAARAAGISVCCPIAPYVRCTTSAPFRCVTDEGYEGCGEDYKPGVECPDDGCCQNPEKCCQGGCCMDGGEGQPRIVEDLPTPQPASTPLPPGVSRSATPSISVSQSVSATPSTTPSLSPSSSTTPSPEDGNAACFPADATVEVEDGSVKTMEQLDTGDRVRVSHGGFSEVFMWTHRDKEWKGDIYVEVVSMEGHRIVATVGHMLYVCRMTGDECEREIGDVEKIQRGDGIIIVEVDHERVVRVLETRRIFSRGLYNPQTLHGDIAVNGVLSTCYTKVVPIRAAHGLLAPLRGVHRFFETVSRIEERRLLPKRA